MNFKNKLILISALLAACSPGQPSSSIPVLKVSTFPLSAAYTALVKSGATTNFNSVATQGGVTCPGTTVITESAPVPVTFNGQSAVQATETVTISMPTCTPSIVGVSSTPVYDLNYNPLGLIIPGQQYSVVASTPIIPASVVVGNSGTFATYNNYTDFTKTVPIGQTTISYTVASQSPTSALVTLLSISTDNSSSVTATESIQYSLSTAGVLKNIGDNLQYSSTGGSASLVLTAQ